MITKMDDLQDIRVFLLDMDGTFYLDDTLLPGALAFLKRCRQSKKRFCFLTNNSSKSPADYIHKLAQLGAVIQRDEILTSADATLAYLAENQFSKDILLFGTASLEAQFRDAGYRFAQSIAQAPFAPSAVVLGFDTSMDYAKLTALCNAVRAGLPYIATHPDFNCPTSDGYIPDIGAMMAFVQASTGRCADAVIGKPNAYIAQAAAKRFGCAVEQLCMVGDRLYTDIALGASGCKTVLVLSGETKAEDLAQSPIVPNLVCANLQELIGQCGI